MPYLSRVSMNPLRSGAQLLLRNPQAMHAAVLGGLSRQPVTERVLWRLERAPHRLSVLVLTESRPSWEHLVEQAGWPSSDESQALVKPYEPLLEQVARGREFAFLLRANPASSTKNPDAPTVRQKERLTEPRSRGVRVAHRTAEHQLTWFTDRVGKWGFSLPQSAAGEPTVRLVARDRIVFRKRDNGPTVTLQTATWDGVLRVEDVNLARQTLLAGVGPGKAYGLGLLTLAPPRSGSV